MTGPASPTRGILDTTVFIAREAFRGLDFDRLPEESAISVVTLGELQAGVLVAGDTATRALRLRTLSAAQSMTTLGIDADVAVAWAQLRVELRETGRRMGVNDSWIAATALAHDVPIVTQDADFDDVPGLAVIHV